jgi:hypothetical protein
LQERRQAACEGVAARVFVEFGDEHVLHLRVRRVLLFDLRHDRLNTRTSVDGKKNRAVHVSSFWACKSDGRVLLANQRSSQRGTHRERLLLFGAGELKPGERQREGAQAEGEKHEREPPRIFLDALRHEEVVRGHDAALDEATPRAPRVDALQQARPKPTLVLHRSRHCASRVRQKQRRGVCPGRRTLGYERVDVWGEGRPVGEVLQRRGDDHTPADHRPRRATLGRHERASTEPVSTVGDESHRAGHEKRHESRTLHLHIRSA